MGARTVVIFAPPNLQAYVNERTRTELQQFFGAERAVGLGDGALRDMAYSEIACFDPLDAAFDSAAMARRDAVFLRSRSVSDADSASALEDLDLIRLHDRVPILRAQDSTLDLVAAWKEDWYGRAVRVCFVAEALQMPREAVLTAAKSRQLVGGVFCTYKFSVAIDGGKKKNQDLPLSGEEPRRRAKSRVYGEATRAAEHDGVVRYLSHTAQEKHRTELKRLKDIHAEQLAHALAAHVLNKAETAGRLQRAHERALIELKSQVRSLTSQVEGDQERVKEADKVFRARDAELSYSVGLARQKGAVTALALKWESATAAATAYLCAAQLAKVAIEAERGELSARCTALAAELSAARTARKAERKGLEAARVAFEAERAAVEAERDDLAARCAALESQHGELSTRCEAGEARSVALEAHRAALLDDTYETRLERATPTSDDVAQSRFRASVQTKSILAEILAYAPEISFRRIGMVIALCGLFVNNALVSLQLLPRVRAELLAKLAPTPRTTATWVADMHAHAVSQLVLKMVAAGNVAMSSDVGHKTCTAMAVLVHLMVPDGNGGKKPDYFLVDNAKVRGETGRSIALVLWTLLLMWREIAGAVDDATLERCGLSRTTTKLRGLAGDGCGIMMGAMFGTVGQLTTLNEYFIAMAQCVHHDLSKMLETAYSGTVEEKFDIYKMSLLSTLKLMAWLQESVGYDVLKTLIAFMIEKAREAGKEGELRMLGHWPDYIATTRWGTMATAITQLVGSVDGVMFTETENWYMIRKVADLMYMYWPTAADRAEVERGSPLACAMTLGPTAMNVRKRLWQWLGNKELHVSGYLWAALISVAHEAQMKYAYTPSHKYPDSPDYKSMLEEQCNKALKLFFEFTRNLHFAVVGTSSKFARAVAGLMTAIAADCELSVDAIVSDPMETCSEFDGSRVNLRSAVQVILDCGDEELRRYADEWPGFGAGSTMAALSHVWHETKELSPGAASALEAYGGAYVNYFPHSHIVEERAVKTCLSAWHGRAGTSAKLMTARTTGIALSRKAQHEAVMALARKNPRLGRNVHVKAGKESERKRQDGSAAPAQVRRFEHTKESTAEFVTGAIARADAAARHARATAGRASAWAKLETLPVSDERPAVASNLSNLFPLGSYNSKEKICAELTARGVSWSVGESWLEKETNIGLTFKQKLRALPDVVTDPASKESFLKRLGPSWEEDDADEDHAERFLAADDVNPFGENDGEALE
ncbi:hypothetical protein M885DRAFT_569776 [Pelagophyceae sp. CCMP2097]|nr:hypothetical protein M885DRAFT_569776 [Pelagophyceae sp. CCMP2097]